MKKALGFMIALILSMNLTAVCQAEIIPISEKPLIGIAWCSDTDSEFFTAVTGYTETDGIKIIEAVERIDKAFAVGLQFHPEAAIVKNLENAENQNNYMDFETALSIFRRIVWEADSLEQSEAA